jgi:hypothetical protein
MYFYESQMKMFMDNARFYVLQNIYLKNSVFLRIHTKWQHSHSHLTHSCIDHIDVCKTP